MTKRPFARWNSDAAQIARVASSSHFAVFASTSGAIVSRTRLWYALSQATFAKVRFNLDAPERVVVIPQTAVSFNPYGNAVFVISKTKRAEGEKDMQGKPLTGDKLIVKQRFVKTGATRGDLIAVTDGLKVGEQVVTSGLLKLRNDAELTINNKVQPGAQARPEPENR
mgnify:CR=1 FL=1